MKFKLKLVFRASVAILLLFLGACTPELTFHVTRPAKLPISNIDNVAIGSFADETGENITLPGGLNSKRLSSRSDLHPTIQEFKSNKKAAEFIRSMITAGLSTSGQYRLIETGTVTPDSGGAVPDPTRTAVVTAKVKYYEFNTEEAEKVFHLLLATKGGLSFADQAVLMATKRGIIVAAERGRKGFQVNTPYLEKIAALEVAFDLTRQSSGEKIVNTQRYHAYFTQKWGGNPKTSHLPHKLKNIIVVKYKKNQSLAQLVKTSAAELELALLDPDEYLASGGKLRTNRSVVKNSLDIQAELAKSVVDKYLKQISRYTEETKLEIASGDSIAVNYLKGNAYEMAINRLENLERKEEDSFNLALAYESIAENDQAAKYYQEALDKNPGNNSYKESLKRVRRN